MKKRRAALRHILENNNFVPQPVPPSGGTGGIPLRGNRNPEVENTAAVRPRSFTGFQKKVYSAVSRIPKGRVRSYKWVAVNISNPRAFRAVGSALNKNPYPGVIPCHRVVKSDGSIGGYSKGAALKARILKDEGIDCTAGRCYNLK